MFEYLAKTERDVAIAAIYRALLRLFESKIAGRDIQATPTRPCSPVAAGNEVEKLASRIVLDIIEVEQRDLASIPPEQTSRYTSQLAQLASSRYRADKAAKSEAARFLKEIDPADADAGFAVR